MTVGSVASSCGVDLANAKRNADFHALFRSVPEQDMLIEDYGCALQKEILLQGRMYISENHVCFNANIFGWVTNLVIAVSDIVEIEKRSTAIIIPNAIQISTLHAKHSFASFLSRDQAYDLLIDVWRCVRPPQQPIEGQKVSETDYESDTSESTFSSSSSIGSSPRPRPASPAEKSAQVQDKTECECGKNNSHYPVIVMDQIFDCPMEKIFQLLYEGDFIKTFLADVQKTTDIQITEWRNGDGEGEGGAERVREISYVKPLNGAIGPKSTRCLLSEEIMHKDFKDYVTQITTTQTPDVPSGGAFSVKTRTCLTWAEKGKTRVFVSVLVDFTKSSWLKSTIEKACIDGQMTYYKDLEAALRRFTEKQKHVGLSKADRRKRKVKKEKRRLKKTPKNIEEPVLGWKDKAIRYIRQLSAPSTTQLIVFGMCTMMLINFYIASKLATVEKRLHQYSQGVSDNKKAAQKPMASDQGETVWAWLVKNRLDAHMDTLGTMLQRAEENMEQVSRAVEEQKEKIKNKRV
ncbi:GRAM domain-containing protein [Phycomyces blakesleeanus]|uniref:GRAM domain-containing protein n=1 Tax=Phycomyces blakesleeanus TaxID=4837 RepID=A0ABR3AY29_PHYBL